MVESEKSSHAEEPLKVNIGEPFHITADLTAVESMDGETLIVKTILVDVEGIGPGRIQIVKDPEAFSDNSNLPMRTPVGPVRITRVIENEEETIDYETHPFTIAVIVGSTQEEKVLHISCDLSYEDKIFKGHVFQDAMRFEEQDLPAAYASSWVDSEENRCELYFPPIQEVLWKIQLTFGQNTKDPMDIFGNPVRA